MPWSQRAIILAAGLLLCGPAVGQILFPGGPGASDNESPHPTPVYVEDSPAAQDLFIQARQMRSQDRRAEAAGLYQRIVDEYRYKLIAQPALAGQDAKATVYIDALLAVRRELTSDPQLLATYRALYEPAAQRALETAGIEPQALESVVDRYWVCPSGLEASLRLAAAWLERADPANAARVLEAVADHPDLAPHAVRWHLLQAATALFSNDQGKLKRHREDLLERGDKAALAELTHWSADVRRPTVHSAVDGQSPVATTALPEAFESPLWEHNVTWTGGAPQARGLMGNNVNAQVMIGGNGQVRRFVNGRPVNAVEPAGPPLLPVYDGDRLYLNQGWSMLALDGMSGQVLWRHESDTAENQRNNPYGRGMPAMEVRAVAVDGARVAGIIGNQLTWPMPRMENLPTTTLVCVNRDDGQMLWRIRPADLDPGLMHAAFHGTPLAGGDGGRFYVLLRRNQMSAFQDAFVAAVDAATGKLIWKRHLSSASLANASQGLGSSQMLLHRGRLYVTDNMSAVACLQARSGLVQWLRLVPPLPLSGPGGRHNIGMIMRQPGSGAEVDRPVMAKAGLVVPPFDPGSSALLLDPDSGALLRKMLGLVWSQSAYLMPVPTEGSGDSGGDVLCVGANITLMDGQTFEPRWQTDVAGGATPRGRVAVTANRVLVAASDRLVMIDLKDGKVVARMPLLFGGNLLALPGQVLVSSPGAVRSFMAWDQAYKLLTERIERDPGDPAPALALAHVAISVQKNQVALEAVDRALHALHQHALAQGRPGVIAGSDRNTEDRALFRKVLSLVDPKVTRDATLRRALFERLASAAVSAADQAAYAIALGDFLVEVGQFEEAVDQYQAVLLSPSLSSQLYERPAVARQAGLECKLKLMKLVKEQGSRFYARYEAQAAQRLTELTSAPVPDAAALLEIARQYPLARCVPSALVAAADALGVDEPYEAIKHYRRAFQLTDDAGLVQRIAGQLTLAYLKVKQPRQARQWLQQLQRARPDLRPLRNGRPVRIDQWLAELPADLGPDDRLPTLAMPLGKPTLLAGRLLTPVAQPRALWPRDAIVTLKDGRLSLRAGPSLQPRWTFDAGMPAVQLLWLSPEQALFWSDQTATLSAIDARTGALAWPTIEVRKLLDTVGDERQRRARRPPEQREFLEDINQPLIVRDGRVQLAQQRAAGYLVAVNDTMLCLADHLGRVVGVDRRTGQVLWRLMSPMDELALLTMNDDSVALCGVNGWGTDAQSHALMVLDATTGEPRLPNIEKNDEVAWIHLTADDHLVAAGGSEVASYQLRDGVLAWRMALPQLHVAGSGQVAGDSLVLSVDLRGEDQPTRAGMALIFIDLSTGQMLGRSPRPLEELATPLDLVPAGERWHLRNWQQAQCFTRDGQTRWSDAIAEPRKGLVTQLLTDHYQVLLSASGDNPRPVLIVDGMVIHQGNAPDLGAYRLYLLDRDTGSIVGEFPILGLKQPIDPAQAAVLDGRIILSTPTQTIVIPGK